MRSRIVLLVLALALAACGAATENLATTTTSSPTSTTATTTAPPPTTTSLPTTTTTTEPVVVSGAGLLVAHENGIDLSIGDDLVTVFAGAPIAAAFADGMGGVVYQPAVSDLERPGWDWWTDLPEPILFWPSGNPIEHPIMWVPSLGAAPQILVIDDGDTWIELLDVTTLGDRPVVVYEREVSLQGSCDGLEDFTECYFESMRTRLAARDLETGDEWSLGLSGSFEWRARASIAGAQAVVDLSNLDYCLPAEMRVVDVSAMLALERDTSITSVTEDGSRIIGLGDDCATGDSCANPGCAGFSAPALSREGSSLAYLEYYTDCCGRPSNETDLVVWDLDANRERLRLHLGQDRWAEWIDHDGEMTVVGFSDGGAILVDADGVISGLPPGPRYSLWEE